jgi:hypothetical protein
LDWTDRFAVGIPAILLATCQTVGCRISIEYHTSVHRTMQSWLEQVPIAGWILWWIAETLLFEQMLRWLFVHAGRDKAVQEDGIGKGIGKRIFLIFAGLLIAWLPVLLSHDPGFYNYDIYGQVPQVMYPEVPYNTHHSLLSTLVMGGVITIGYRIFGTMEKAVFLHSCFQMILCAATFSYSLDFWYRRLNRKWLLGVGFCFYAFLPTIALFSVSTTKDVVCSLALFIAFHLLYELYENTEGFFRKKEKIAALSCSLIVGALYRKNVIYAFFLYLVLCAVFCKKQKRKIISLFAGTILLTMLLSVGMETLLHAEKGSAVEALCVPLQQIARVYTDKGEAAFDSEELQLLDRLYQEKDLEALMDFYEQAVEENRTIDRWEHSGIFRWLMSCRDAREYLAMEQSGETLRDYQETQLLDDYWMMRGLDYSEVILTEKDREYIRPYVEATLNSLADRYTFTAEEEKKFEDSLRNNYGYPRYEDCEEYIKKHNE